MEVKINTDIAVTVFLETVNYLLMVDEKKEKSVCVWTNKNQFVNFTKKDFDRVCLKKVNPNNYREFLRIFREMGWIVCQNERFTNIQWIYGKSHRVVTVNYSRLQCLRKLEANKN